MSTCVLTFVTKWNNASISCVITVTTRVIKLLCSIGCAVGLGDSAVSVHGVRCMWSGANLSSSLLNDVLLFCNPITTTPVFTTQAHSLSCVLSSYPARSWVNTSTSASSVLLSSPLTYNTLHYLFFLQGWLTDMHPPPRQDYVSISLAGQGSGSYNNSKQWRRQSCWRVSESCLCPHSAGLVPDTFQTCLWNLKSAWSSVSRAVIQSDVLCLWWNIFTISS